MLSRYLRTEAQDFEFGDALLVSGGPGACVPLDKNSTFSLHANGTYETVARDHVLGRKSDRTGLTAWYLGPQLGCTWGDHFSAQAGVDVPLRIANKGFQNVQDHRLHGGFTLRF